MTVHDRIRQLVQANDVVLFMKGTRTAPRCGFSARVVEILDDYLEDYATVDVLSDPGLREGIKSFSSWPTFPQLYVRQKFCGGSDIVSELAQSGELAELLGVRPIERLEPEVQITPAAKAAFLRFWEAQGETDEPVARLTIASDWEPLLDLDERREGDVVIEQGGLALVMTRSTAKRANGVRIDFLEGARVGFRVDNPRRPATVKPLAVEVLALWIQRSKPHLLLDVRRPEERGTARIEPSQPLDGAMRAMLETMDRHKAIVCYSHHGRRSQRAAEHLIAMGFRDVYTLQGGIDAWSTQVDAGVRRY